MAVDQKDVLTRLKEARAQAQSSTSPFFFLKAGEKALVRLLRDYDEMVAISSHRKFDETARKYIHHVCASEYNQQCQVCLDAKLDWKLKAQDFFYLPCYVHKKVGADGLTREIAQPFLLEMASYDGILAGLGGIFEAEDNVKGTITNCDLVIQRIGEGNKAKYTVVARRGTPAPLPSGTVSPDNETIRSDVEIAHPMLMVETEVASVDEFADLADVPF
jgi:hypothetical protein